ncbi:MAG: sel1 repeat family protein, partial [Sulfurovum sp.]|nr:sel1 repeat family protein [Sulfurovum sp.]
VQEDKAKAAEFYAKACEGNVALGCLALAFMYESGEGVKQDIQKAKEFYDKACKGGDVDGCEKYKKLLNP